jgi:hypothetical protein
MKRLDFDPRFAQSGHPVAIFPLAAFLQNFDAFKSFQNVPFRTQGARSTQAAML